MRCQPPVRSCRHANIATEAGSPNRLNCRSRHLRRGLGNRQGSPAGSVRGSAPQICDIPRIGEARPDAARADKRTVRVSQRAEAPRSTPAGQRPSDLRDTKHRGDIFLRPRWVKRRPTGGHRGPPPHVLRSGGMRATTSARSDHVTCGGTGNEAWRRRNAEAWTPTPIAMRCQPPVRSCCHANIVTEACSPNHLNCRSRHLRRGLGNRADSQRGV
jgi:hypothetical protein